jgi:hypothetical protein
MAFCVLPNHKKIINGVVVMYSFKNIHFFLILTTIVGASSLDAACCGKRKKPVTALTLSTTPYKKGDKIDIGQTTVEVVSDEIYLGQRNVLTIKKHACGPVPLGYRELMVLPDKNGKIFSITPRSCVPSYAAWALVGVYGVAAISLSLKS